MGVGEFMQRYWWLIGAIAGGLAFLWAMYRRYRAGSLIWTAMASLVDNRRYAVPLVVVGVLGLSYFISLDVFGDPRMTDGELVWEEMHWWERGIMLTTLASILVVWSAALQHAWRRGRKALAILMMLVWPVAVLYAVLRHNET